MFTTKKYPSLFSVVFYDLLANTKASLNDPEIMDEKWQESTCHLCPGTDQGRLAQPSPILGCLQTPMKLSGGRGPVDGITGQGYIVGGKGHAQEALHHQCKKTKAHQHMTTLHLVYSIAKILKMENTAWCYISLGLIQNTCLTRLAFSLSPKKKKTKTNLANLQFS